MATKRERLFSFGLGFAAALLFTFLFLSAKHPSTSSAKKYQQEQQRQVSSNSNDPARDSAAQSRLLAESHQLLTDQRSIIDLLKTQLVEKKSVPKEKEIHLKSQAGQDRWMYESVFYEMDKRGEKGVFVEFGARDGVEHSNTYFYEHALGWRGLLVEAVEWEFKSIAQTRPNSLAVHGAVCAKPGTVEFMVAKAGGLHGIVEDYADHRKEWDDHHISVPCFTLNSLLEQAQLRHVNYMTVDTEGSEVTVLEAFDFNKFVVDYIQVEMLVGTAQAAEKKEKLEQLMSKVGYELLHEYVVAPNDTIDMIYKRTRKADMGKWEELKEKGFKQS